MPSGQMPGCWTQLPSLNVVPTQGSNKGGYNVRVDFSNLGAEVASKISDLEVSSTASEWILRDFEVIRGVSGIAGCS